MWMEFRGQSQIVPLGMGVTCVKTACPELLHCSVMVGNKIGDILIASPTSYKRYATKPTTK